MPALSTWWRLDVAELAPAAHTDAVEAVGAGLLRRLDEGHRRYHTARHLVEMIWALEELEDATVLDSRSAAVARLAAWFHDAVYDPASGPGDNETASASLASRELQALGVARDDIATVHTLVLATEQHSIGDTHGIMAAFHDADLWILSAPEERFDEYCLQVRDEYRFVPDAAYAAGRARVLEPFLHRDAVYASAHAQASWEDRARQNLARELARLGNRVSS